MAYNKKRHLEDNIAAIDTAFTLKRNGKPAEGAERETLSKFSGFGGLKCVLWDLNTVRSEALSPSDRELLPLIEKLHRSVRKHSSGAGQYKQRMDSLKGSVLTGFYTPDQAVFAIGEALITPSMRDLSVLDPSAGVGAFGNMLSVFSPSSRITAFEQDEITATVLSVLRDSDTVHTAGFEQMPPAMAGSFDMVLSNVPFGSFSVFDKQYTHHPDPVRKLAGGSIHNFFFIKGIDSLREGGLLAYITSRSVADTAANAQYRRWLVENANLVSAIRLPDNLFTEHSGTSAGTDLLVFQKESNKNGVLSENEKMYLQSHTPFDGVSVNAMFTDGRNAICSRYALGTNQYGQPAMEYEWKESWEDFGHRLSEKLSADVAQRFSESLFLSGKTLPGPVTAATSNTHISDTPGALFNVGKVSAGSLARRTFTGVSLPWYQDGTMVKQDGQCGTLDIPWRGDALFVPMDLSSLEALKVRDYIALRDAYRLLSDSERESGENRNDLRSELVGAYEKFTGFYGDLNDKTNRPLLLSDPMGREVLSLERTVKGEKRLADIFYRPVTFSPRVEHTDSAEEALAISLNLYGKVEPQVMCDLTDRSWEDLIEELSSRVYFNPMTGTYQISEQFIAGDVISRSEQVAAYADRYPENKEIQRSLEAFHAVIPQRVPFEDLYLNLGERWIPSSVYSEFASELFQTVVHIIYEPAIDEYSVVAKEKNALINEKYLVETTDGDRYDGEVMLRYALYNTIPQITMDVKGDDGIMYRVTDTVAQQRAMAVTEDISREFGLWMDRQNDGFKQFMTERYNRLFNCYHRPRYDGSHLTLSDLNLKGLGYQQVHPSQRDAVWMFLLNQGGIADHKVGGGKTLLGCILAHEMKRLGISNKTVITAIKANVDKVATEYMTAYPDDKVLYPMEKDFLPRNREKLLHDIKNNDWDAIILSHEQFAKLPMPADIQLKVLTGELDSVNESLTTYEKMGGSVSSRMLSGLQTRRKNLQTKIERLNSAMEKRKDNVPDLREMGIQHIIVDESQDYKNLQFHTRNERVAGIGNPQGSQRALDMLYAIRTLQDEKDMDLQATFMSGTTISNSLVEMYLLFKYHRPREMERQNIRCFDAWAATFTRKSSEFEIGVTGRVILKERYRYFVKVPELSGFYRAITDYRSGKDIGLDEPSIDARVHVLPQTPEHVEFTKRLVMFAQTGDGEYIGRGELSDSAKKAKMLVATGLANKMAVDMRLLDEVFFHDHPNNKARSAAAIIAENYHKYDAQKGTQLLFCDLGVFRPGQWNIYSEIKRLLVEEHGIPADEIRFMQESKNVEAKSNLTDAVNAGLIRVVLGSTMVLGTGINMQERVCALHHLDMPWTPKDLEQRNGRGARPGNRIAKEELDNKLPVNYYATEHSLDAYKYHLVHMKASFIAQVKSGAVGKRMIDEGSYDESFGMNVMEFVALLTGNQDLLEKAKIEKQIDALESDRRIFTSSLAGARSRLTHERQSLQHLTSVIAEMKADLQLFDKIAPVSADGARPAILKVAGVRTSDEKLMAARLNEIAGSVRTDGKYVKVGTLGDFPVVVKTSVEVDKDGNHRSVNRFFVQGLGRSQIKYQYNNGYIATNPALCCSNFPKAMDRIPSLIEQYQQRVHTTSKDIGILENMTADSWGREQELTELRAKVVLLDKSIELELGKTQHYQLGKIELNATGTGKVIDTLAEDVTDAPENKPWENTPKLRR